MLCGCNNYLGRIRDTKKATPEVTGTLDFKWPRDATIIVAVQGLNEDVALDLKPAINELLIRMSSWNNVLKERLKLEPFPGLQQQTVLPPPAFRNRARSADLKTWARYDALVSFAPLPVYKEANLERPERSVRFPSSALGIYCRRSRFGSPTLYCGEPPGYVGSDEWQAGRSWFESDQFRFTLLHELGHVLGLAHEHQNPFRKLERDKAWKPVDEVLRIVQARERSRIDETYVRENLVTEWPGIGSASRNGRGTWAPTPPTSIP